MTFDEWNAKNYPDARLPWLIADEERGLGPELSLRDEDLMRAAWEVSRKDAMEANAELLAACKGVRDMVRQMVGQTPFCPSPLAAWTQAMTRMYDAIAKAEKEMEGVAQQAAQQPAQSPASPPSTIDPKFLTTISPGEFGEELMP